MIDHKVIIWTVVKRVWYKAFLQMKEMILLRE